MTEDFGQDTGPDRCACGKMSSPGSYECYGCRHGLPAESRATTDYKRLEARTADMLFRMARQQAHLGSLLLERAEVHRKASL
jgi:hypothetical protein